MASLTLKNMVLIPGSMMISGALTTALCAQWAPTHSVAPVAEQQHKVLFWYDSMYPNICFDKPDKSPLMDMDLVPKYADEEHAAAGVSGVCIDPTQTQNLGIKTAAVTRGPLRYTQTFPANISYNEYQYAIIQAWVAGFVNKVYPLTVGGKVKQGTSLPELTIPDWVEAQSEYLLLRETGGTATQVEGILKCLRPTGMPDDDIRHLKAMRKIQTRFILKVPTDGAIIAFDLRAGMNIAKDNVTAKIQDMDPVWVNVVVSESIVWLIKNASQFAIQVPVRSGKTFSINKWTLLLSVDSATRILQLCLQVNNPDETLKPGINTYLQLTSESESMLLIPSKALTDSGSEQRVIIVDNEDHFVPKLIHVFCGSAGATAIRSGLQEGEKAVASGLFLINSEANIAGALGRMRVQTPGTAAPAVRAH